MRFITATWSVVPSLMVVLTMFSFAPVALGEPWMDGYLAGKRDGIDEGKKQQVRVSEGQKACKDGLLACTATDTNNSICKACLPDSVGGKPYFVTNALTQNETTIRKSAKEACRNDK